MHKTTRRFFTYVIIISSLIMLVACSKGDSNNEIKDMIKLFNAEEESFKLYYYGKKENLLNLKVTYVDSLESIIIDEEYKNTFIIINNLDGRLTFEIEELERIKSLVEKHKYSFYYFGTTEINKFVESGLFLQEILDPSAMSFGYVREGNKYLNSIGIWGVADNEFAKNNELLFLQLLLSEFKYRINLY